MLSCSNITLTRYRYNTGCKIKKYCLSYSTSMVFLLKTLLSDISELKWNTNLLQWLLVFRYDTFMILPVYIYATHKMLFAGVSFEFTIQSDFKWKHLVSTPVKEWMIDNFFNIFLVSSCSWVHNENKFNEYKSGKTAALWLAYSTLNGLFYLCDVSIWDIFFLSPNLKNIVPLWSKN